MNSTFFKNLLVILFFTVTKAASQPSKTFRLENNFLARNISIVKDRIQTVSILNKVSGKTIQFNSGAEFQLRISNGTDEEGTDVNLTSNDFKFDRVIESSSSSLAILLKNKKYGIDITAHYQLNSGEAYARKFLEIKSKKSIAIERIDVEVIALNDIAQPYTIKQITASGPAEWRPGLGQPLYTKKSATFWGIEFPAASNYVKGAIGYCGYLWGNKIEAGKTYVTYKAVVGVGDNPEFIQDAFFDYIGQIRIRPLRLQIQYNSWFDFGPDVSKETFNESVVKINKELVLKRGLTPLNAYVIDDGWEDADADWSEKTWKVNKKFDENFESSLNNVKNARSNLGLWLSPGCFFGAQKAVQKYKSQGFETLDKWMSMAGPKYMELLQKRMLELTAHGISYFKLDGIFGHLNTREFELNGNKYGIPYMPQLGTANLASSDSLLNNPKYDELKTYYLVAGTERLTEIFKKQHEINPNVYIVISNGAYLSPWWLMYVDAVWMINAGDASEGSNRTGELVYRDGVYYDTWKTEKTQFPMNSIFNHEPKKVDSAESKETFSKYLWMSLSRGTGFIELYLKTHQLSDSDWDVLANGLKWAHKVFPYFKKVKMHGGNPNKNEVYGYTGWNDHGGYISVHNPSDVIKVYKIKLDRKLGLGKVKKTYLASSSLDNAGEFLNRMVTSNQVLEISLKPKEVKVLDFLEKR